MVKEKKIRKPKGRKLIVGIVVFFLIVIGYFMAQGRGAP